MRTVQQILSEFDTITKVGLYGLDVIVHGIKDSEEQEKKYTYMSTVGAGAVAIELSHIILSRKKD